MPLYHRALYCTVSDGSKIYCVDIGDPKGFPVVLLHGNAMDGSYFQSTVKILTGSGHLSESAHHQSSSGDHSSAPDKEDHSSCSSQPMSETIEADSSYTPSCRYLLIDSREHGKSVTGSSGKNAAQKINFALMAQDLEEVLQQLHIGKCLLAGHSDGANLAMVYASRYPGRVAGLLLNSGNLKVQDLKWYVRAAIRLQYAGLCTLSAIFHPAKKMAAVTDLMLHDLPVTEKQLAGINVPVWVLTGEHDIIQRSASERLSQLFPRCRLIIHKDTGHDLPIQDPAFFAKLIRQLVREILKDNL